ncbi:TraC family protein (plasmid) [Rhizobium leguminosarum]|nr:TraC family protein [Rhizobium leguminosarum]
MKKPSAKLRGEIAKLQEQLKIAETREAERIGRIALKAGLGEIEIDEAELQAAFEQLTKRFRGGQGATAGKRKGRGSRRLAANRAGHVWRGRGQRWRGLNAWRGR